MAAAVSLPAAPLSASAIARRRAVTLTGLGCALAAALWLLTLASKLPETPVWSSALFPLFDFAAGWKCLQTARGLRAEARKAWLCFGYGCLCFGFGELVWGIYEVYFGINVPTPSIADAGYLAFPCFFIAGIWFYHNRSRSRAFNRVQVGNLGIIFSAIVLGYVFVIQGLVQASDSLPAVLMQVAYGIEIMAALCFGLIVVSLHSSGRKRIVLTLVVVAIASLNATYFVFSYAVIGGDYTGANPVNLLYMISFTFIYWAAFEYPLLPIDDSSDRAILQSNDWARQWETLLPAVAIAGLMVAAFWFRDLLSEALLPYIGAGGFVFVCSLALRNWWGHAVETNLRSEAMASQVQLERANKELRAEMQTRALVQEELRQSQKMEALGQLTGGVAHDFNNLLAVILSNLEMAEDCAEPGTELHEFLSDASDAAKRGASLTQRLLALSRKQSLKPEPLSLDELLAGMHRLLERTLGETIRVRIAKAEPTGSCAPDRAQLESAILNLAINARDAMPHGGELCIETTNASFDEQHAAAHPEVRAGSYVLISVRDTGKGIEPEVMARVFEPFFTTKGVGQGTGLGLSMVYGFAKQSGGHVAIESQPGHGTTVRLYLPSFKGTVARAEASAPRATPRGQGESVLVVEDEPAVRKLVVTILKGLGYKVVAAEDGVQALAMLDTLDSLDLLLSDVVLPGGMSGRELARQIEEQRPDVNVLLMSGYALEVLRKDGELAPGTELLHKPFRKAELASKVRAALEGRAKAPAAGY